VPPVASQPLTPEPSPTEIATPTPEPTPSPTLSPSPSPTPTPTPTPAPTPTPTPVPSPTPTPTPEPGASVAVVTESGCCGLFTWLDADHVLVFDQPAGEKSGTWFVDVEDGERRSFSPGFGVSSRNGVFATPVQGAGHTLILDASGATVGSVQNGGAVVWPSPSGTRVAWLERMAIATPSSSVNRANRLWVANGDGSSARPLLDLQAAALQWLPDDRHLVVAARNLAAQSAGIWLIDTDTGEVRILVETLFLQAMRVSPDGERVAFLRTLADDPALNGLWVVETFGDGVWRVPGQGSYRWHSDSRSLWLLEIGAGWDEPDRLVLVDVESGATVTGMSLDGRVSNDAWEVAPDGRRVAFWRVADNQVVVQGWLPERDG
jgi:hypothetical protein